MRLPRVRLRFSLRTLIVSDRNLSALRNLTGLTRLTVDHLGLQSGITDGGLVYLSNMTRLESLDLTGCQITGRGLAALRNLKRLKRLSLGWTQVDDAGLEVIGGFPLPESLEIYPTKITNAGLVHLRGLTNVRRLWASDNAVRRAAIDELKKANPLLKEGP